MALVHATGTTEGLRGRQSKSVEDLFSLHLPCLPPGSAVKAIGGSHCLKQSLCGISVEVAETLVRGRKVAVRPSMTTHKRPLPSVHAPSHSPFLRDSGFLPSQTQS